MPTFNTHMCQRGFSYTDLEMFTISIHSDCRQLQRKGNVNGNASVGIRILRRIMVHQVLHLHKLLRMPLRLLHTGYVSDNVKTSFLCVKIPWLSISDSRELYSLEVVPVLGVMEVMEAWPA